MDLTQIKIFLLLISLVKSLTICDDGSFCEDSETCCLMSSSSNAFGCCPYKSGVCCNDNKHCCPEKTTCDVPHLKCVSSLNFLITDMIMPLLAKPQTRLFDIKESNSLEQILNCMKSFVPSDLAKNYLGDENGHIETLRKISIEGKNIYDICLKKELIR